MPDLALEHLSMLPFNDARFFTGEGDMKSENALIDISKSAAGAFGAAGVCGSQGLWGGWDIASALPARMLRLGVLPVELGQVVGGTDKCEAMSAFSFHGL